MNDKRKQDLVQRCIEWTEEAEDVVCCPVCYEIQGNLFLCSVGHHVCMKCKDQIGNSCPTCKSAFTGTKSFMMKDLSEILKNLKISLNDLNKVMLLSDNKSEYIAFIKKLLTNLSVFLNETSKSMAFFNKYLQNPMHSDKTDLEEQFKSLTFQLNNLTLHMENVKVDLNLLKK